MGFKGPIIIALIAIFILCLKQYMNGPVCESKARLDGKIVIITGPSAGIGKETTKDLASRGAKIYMACRSEARCESARSEIVQETKVDPAQLIILKLDLASLKSVRSFVKEFQARESRLNILINNAGVALFLERTLTEDGFEMTMGVNHLGHFLLTNLLITELVAAKPSRVVTLSALIAEYSSPIRMDNLMLEEDYSGTQAYTFSKLANVMFTKELGRRLQGKGVTTYALHPGAIPSNLIRYAFPFEFSDWGPKIMNFILWPIWKSEKQGAQTTICCAVDEQMGQETGKYYSDCAVKKDPMYSVSQENNTKLWEFSEELVGLSKQEIHPLLQ